MQILAFEMLKNAPKNQKPWKSGKESMKIPTQMVLSDEQLDRILELLAYSDEEWASKKIIARG